MLKAMLKPILQETIKSILSNEDEKGYFVARTDGFTQWWELSEPIIIPESVDYKLEITLMSSTPAFYAYGSGTTNNNNRLVFAGEDSNVFGLAFSNNVINNSWVLSESVLLVERASKVTKLYVDGVELTSSSLDTEIIISRLGGRYEGTTSIQPISGYMKDFYFEINGVKTIKIPLTNRSQGATQLATIGSVNATMVGYTPDVWEQE